MKFIFEQTTDDLLDFGKSTLKKSLFVKQFGIVIACLILLNIDRSLFSDEIQTESLISWILPVAIIVFVWIFISRIVLKKQIWNPGNKQTMMGVWEIDLSENFIRVLTPVSDTIYQWSAFSELGQSTKSYFLHIGKIQAIVIPKRAFQGDVEMEEFEEFVDFRID